MAERLGLRRCRWSGYVPDDRLLDSLAAADVLIATQRPETQGLLWPSKLSLMRHMGLPLVWVGPTNGELADSLRSHQGDAGIFEPGQALALAEWLRNLPPTRGPVDGATIRERAEADRDAGIQWWIRKLAESR